VSRDLVYFSPIPWHGLYQRPQHMARALALGRRVLFVEPRTLHAPPPPADGLAGAAPQLSFLALPVLPVNARQPWLRAAARLGAQVALLRDGLARRQALLLRGKLAALGFGEPLLLFGHPDFAALRETLPGAPLAYDHMDDVLAFGRPPAALRRELGALVREAAVLSASAEHLAAQLRALGGRDVLRIGNGVELDHFAPASPPRPEPAALAALPHPRCLYMGSVAEWFDVELLHAVARALPAASFPVLGPVRPALAARLREAPPNCHYLGARTYAELPAWLQHADAGLIPFQRTPLTAGVDPVKLYEYLAAGLPVVATPFSTELAAVAAAGGLSLAADAASFAAALSAQLAAAPSPARLRALAEPRRWERVLAPLVSALDAI
jgi:UDP-galactopyranose mutase